jgi:hypothetical protein
LLKKAAILSLLSDLRVFVAGGRVSGLMILCLCEPVFPGAIEGRPRRAYIAFICCIPV